MLEHCGQQYQSEGFVNKARGIFENSKNVDEFLEEFGKYYRKLAEDEEWRLLLG